MIMIKIYIRNDSPPGQETAHLYTDTHDRQELRQAASECGVDPETEYYLGFLDEPETSQTEPMMVPFLHYNLQGSILERAKSLFRVVNDKELSDDLIDRYVLTGSPMDKAGAYGIQDKDFPLVDHIEGSYDNVMGFPTEDIIKHLKIKAD